VRRTLLLALVLSLAFPLVSRADMQQAALRVAEQGAADLAASCRRDTPVDDATCGEVPLSPSVADRYMKEYLASSTHITLGMQYSLGNQLPLRHAAWLGTHNSFNTTANAATLSQLDANQQLSLTDQLRSDMRSLELDAHWFPSLAAAGFGPVLCHAEGADTGHAGCTTEQPLVNGLREIATWLRANPRQVVLLYLEDHLDNDEGYADGAQAVRSAFGNLLYAPGGRSCTPLPLHRTRNDVLAARKQVIVISDCHSGTGWNGAIFSGAARAKDETGPAGYGVDGQCDPTRPPAAYDDRLLRVFEDSTALTALRSQESHPINERKAATLQRCAVDITGFDQLLPYDGRLRASVWSWAPGQPTTGSCALQKGDGWHSADCRTRHPFACRTASGWRIDRVSAPAQARGRCKGAQVGTPRYGWEAAQLQAAMRAAGVSGVWLSLTGGGKTWRAHDRPS
jgi:hypothetical protein